MLATLTTTPDKLWSEAAASRDASLRKRAPDLPTYRVAPWNPEPLLLLEKGLPWILLPYDKDPLRTHDGGYPFPRRIKSDLQDLAARGVDFDALAIAHELDPKGPVAPLIPKIPPAGLLCSPETTKTLIGNTPATKASKRMAATLNHAGDAVARSAPKVLLGLALAPIAVVAAPLVLLAAAASGVDPIVFGVLHVDPPDGRRTSRPTRLAARRSAAAEPGDKADPKAGEHLAMWYPLADWQW